MMGNYYDLVLGLIPLSLLGVTGILSVVGLPLTSAVPIGAAVAALVVGHALFVNGPSDSTPTPTTSDSNASVAPPTAD
jgi:hypothetical protein